ncbi:unnamed protein product [Coregonus sp. 'balchen']|nr:unnamed protein product [Coregonus sp. 'balchen']
MAITLLLIITFYLGSHTTVFTVMVTAASSSNLSPPGQPHIINTNETVSPLVSSSFLSSPLPPSPNIPSHHLEGERVGSNGILLSWTMPSDSRIDGYVIRYKEVCPYPDTTFKEVTKHLASLRPFSTSFYQVYL